MSTFASPGQSDDQLRPVWQAVAEDLAADWPLEKLAARASLGPKHFRRLCQQSLGRTPAQHITALRLRHALLLPTTTREKVEAISYRVGYRSLLTFSHTFKKLTGRRPSEHRGAARLSCF